MEQRKRTPTGAFTLPTADELRERLHASEARQRASTSETVVGRQRHFTGEQAIARNAPPPAPGERPVREALGNVAVVLSEQVQTQHDVQTALLQMSERIQQLERVVVHAVNVHTKQTRAAVAAVEHGNLLHRQTNQVLVQVSDNLLACTDTLVGFSRALNHNAAVRREVRDSWLVRGLWQAVRHPMWGLMTFAIAVFAYAVVDFVARQ